MKKTIVVLMTLLLAVSAVFADTYTSSKGTADQNYEAGKDAQFVQETTKTNSIVEHGTPNKSLYKTPIYVTSFGQSTDANMIETALKRVKGVSYTFNGKATAEQISGSKTLIIAVGYSAKGMGAAGISAEDEIARAQKILDTVKKEGIQVIFVHIGGAGRTQGNSAILMGMTMPLCSYMIVEESANYDYRFSNFASQNNVPLTFIYATKDLVKVFQNLFTK